MKEYPKVKDFDLVGTYPAFVKSGGGYVWDEVLEYRVWCHSADEGDFYYVFENYEGALEFSQDTEYAEGPLVLVLQEEYIDEPEPGKYQHVKKQRITEWPIEFLDRPKRTVNTIPDFLSPEAPSNRLDILRGLAK